MSTKSFLNEENAPGEIRQKGFHWKRPINLKGSLRTRVALGITLPIFLALVSLSLIHYWREQQIMFDQIQLTAEQLGDTIFGSLRHAMLANDNDMIANAVSDVGNMDDINLVQIIDLYGEVQVASNGEMIGTVQKSVDAGCEECHQFPSEERPRTVLLSGKSEIMRISTPIINETECRLCHQEKTAHLGVLLLDVSLFNTEARLLSDLRIDLLFSVIVTILFTTGIYLLIHKFIVRRVEAFRIPLGEFAEGDLSARLPQPDTPYDELDRLALTFNHMADELARHTQEEKERSLIRNRTIIEERERLARELHDGLAQLLGYVSTKAGTVRLLLRRKRFDQADTHLRQLEEAANELFTETREAILGLKIYGDTDKGLASALNEYTDQFSRLSDLPVRSDISPEIDQLTIPIEAQLQLIRIAQEALTNVRKHSAATRVWVELDRQNGGLELEIRDNGNGFDPDQHSKNGNNQFGLSIMRERAEAIEAEFSIESAQGNGTSIRVFLPIRSE